MTPAPRSQWACLLLVTSALLAHPCPARAADEHDAPLPATRAAHDEHDDHDAPDAHDDDDHDDHDGHDDHDDHSGEIRLPPAAVERNGLRVAPAQPRALGDAFVAPARIGYDEEAMAHVGSVVSGRVAEIRARIGDAVKRGDVLLVIESPELGRAQSEFLQRRTEAEIAAAGVEPARESYERARKLFDETQGIAYGEVQKRELEYRGAVGAAATTKAAERAAENALHLLGISQAQVRQLVDTQEIQPRFEIRAPLDGRVIEREVTLGELVSPEKEKLLVLADTRKLWALVEVPEARLGQVSVGTPVELQLPALPGQRLAGEVSLIGAAVDPATRTARLRIVLDNAAGKLAPGMFARALVSSGAPDAQQVLAVPEEAIQTLEGRPCVFVPVKGEPGTFKPRPVTVGRAVSGYVPIEAGLEAGEEVVVSGTFLLKAQHGKSEAGHGH